MLLRQALPQVPQLELSVCVFVHAVPHRLGVATRAFADAVGVCAVPPVQVRAHGPQVAAKRLPLAVVGHAGPTGGGSAAAAGCATSFRCNSTDHRCHCRAVQFWQLPRPPLSATLRLP